MAPAAPPTPGEAVAQPQEAAHQSGQVGAPNRPRSDAPQNTAYAGLKTPAIHAQPARHSLLPDPPRSPQLDLSSPSSNGTSVVLQEADDDLEWMPEEDIIPDLV